MAFRARVSSWWDSASSEAFRKRRDRDSQFFRSWTREVLVRIRAFSKALRSEEVDLFFISFWIFCGEISGWDWGDFRGERALVFFPGKLLLCFFMYGEVVVLGFVGLFNFFGEDAS